MAKGIMAGTGTPIPSGANAVTSDVMPGVTFIGTGKEKYEGSMAVKGTEIYIPGTSQIVIPSGRYLNGNQIIKGDANLIPSNIKEGVTIFGVTGTYTTILRFNITASNHSEHNGVWVDPGADDWEYVSDGIKVTPRSEEIDTEYYASGYHDYAGVNAHISFLPLIDFSKYTTITITGYMDNNRPCFVTQYNDFAGPQISYDYTNWTYITHQCNASADGYSATFDISSFNGTAYLDMAVPVRDVDRYPNNYVFNWPGRSFYITSIVLS